MTDNDQDLVVVRAIYAETPQAVEIELPRETSIEDARKLAFNELQKVLHGIQKYVSINLDDDHTELQLVDPHTGKTPPKESTTVGQLGTGMVYLIAWPKGWKDGHAPMRDAILRLQDSDTQELIALAPQPKTKQQKKNARKKAAKQRQQNTVSGTYKTIGETLDALYALLLQGLRPGDALVEAAFQEVRRQADVLEKRVSELEKRGLELEKRGLGWEKKVEELEAKLEGAVVQLKEAAVERKDIMTSFLKMTKRANDLCVRQLLNESRDKLAQLSKYKNWEDIVQQLGWESAEKHIRQNVTNLPREWDTETITELMELVIRPNTIRERGNAAAHASIDHDDLKDAIETYPIGRHRSLLEKLYEFAFGVTL